jgi:hypothetical protein
LGRVLSLFSVSSSLFALQNNMKKKKLLFVRFNLRLITALITVSFITLGLGSANFFTISPAVAPRISPSDIW